MRVAVLFSGGKDSTYATYLAEEIGHDVDYLVSMEPARSNSWMFHSINIHLTSLLAQAMDKKHVSAITGGDVEGELDDLTSTLSGLSIEGIVSGAVASTYQHKRVDIICERLGLTHIAPLWGRRQDEVLDEEAAAGMKIIIVAVAARGLNRNWLGRILDEKAIWELVELGKKYGLNICGEGGEYESLVLDAPWFNSRLEIIKTKTDWDGSSGVYWVKQARLVPKSPKKG